MTQEECKEIVDLLMVATERLINAKLASIVKHEIGTVRLVDGGVVYVRPASDISTPSHANPADTSELDDGDVALPNASGQVLAADDSVEILYTQSIADGFIARKYGS